MTREVEMQDDLTPQERKVAEEIVGTPEKKRRTRGPAKKGKRRATRQRAPTHTMRVQDTREAEEVHTPADEPWVRPSTLPDIPRRKGFVQRWIRVALRGENDATNVSRKFREGWVPRKSETLPKSFFAPTIAHGTYAGCIGVEGSILCEMPAPRNAERNDHFADRNQRQTASINQELAVASRHGHAGFGRIQKAEKTEVGMLREVKVSDDELA